MKSSLTKVMALAAAAVLVSSVAGATTITTNATPSMVPDEQPPRINAGDYPSGNWGQDSWQGPAMGKSNFHVRYNADGSYLNAQFPADAATFRINDLQEISYWTKRPVGTPAGRDWWVYIYTRPKGPGMGDCASWYHRRYINNYDTHTDIGNWVQYSTDGGAMTFQQTCAGTSPEMTLTDLQNLVGNDLIEMISVQTDSGWNGFDGYIDGLTIEHDNGNVGRTNFGSMFVPASSAWSLGALAVVLGALMTVVVMRRSAA